jgi:hypothetical protein
VQKALRENHALQCGYCSVGMIMSAVDLLIDNPDPSEQEVRDGLRVVPFARRRHFASRQLVSMIDLQRR